MFNSAIHPRRRGGPGITGPLNGSTSITELCFITFLFGVLAVLCTSGIGAAKERARIARCVGNLKQLASMVDLYKTIHLRYPRNTSIDDFRSFSELTKDYGVFTCPSTDHRVSDVSDLDGGTSYRYFASRRALSRMFLDNDFNHGHGNDTDKIDEDNRGESYSVKLDASRPDRFWQQESGAIYDRDFDHHDGFMNVIYLEDNRWDRLHESVEIIVTPPQPAFAVEVLREGEL